jgi:hypothetical protein
MADARPCALCGGGDEEGLVLKCDGASGAESERGPSRGA